MNMQEKIREIMRVGGENQVELAHRIGVSQSTVHRWYTGSAEPEGPNRDIINGIYETIVGVKPADGPVRDESEVVYFLSRIDGLTDEDVRFLLKNIRSALAANGAEPLQSHPRGQPQPANLLHEEAPSE
jgi:transcriptional regulator with XRE-family HTH domain